MGYSTGEAAILTLIQALADFDTDNTARQDWKPLHSGSAAVYAILRPGPWANVTMTMGSAARTWTTVVEVWRRYSSDAKPLLLQSDVVTIAEQLEKYPTLNGTSGVIDSNVTGGPEMVEVELNNGSLWAKWEINHEWTEEKTVAYAE